MATEAIPTFEQVLADWRKLCHDNLESDYYTVQMPLGQGWYQHIQGYAERINRYLDHVGATGENNPIVPGLPVDDMRRLVTYYTRRIVCAKARDMICDPNVPGYYSNRLAYMRDLRAGLMAVHPHPERVSFNLKQQMLPDAGLQGEIYSYARQEREGLKPAEERLTEIERVRGIYEEVLYKSDRDLPAHAFSHRRRRAELALKSAYESGIPITAMEPGKSAHEIKRNLFIAVRHAAVRGAKNEFNNWGNQRQGAAEYTRWIVDYFPELAARATALEQRFRKATDADKSKLDNAFRELIADAQKLSNEADSSLAFEAAEATAKIEHAVLVDSTAKVAYIDTMLQAPPPRPISYDDEPAFAGTPGYVAALIEKYHADYVEVETGKNTEALEPIYLALHKLSEAQGDPLTNLRAIYSSLMDAGTPLPDGEFESQASDHPICLALDAMYAEAVRRQAPVERPQREPFSSRIMRNIRTGRQKPEYIAPEDARSFP